MQAEKAVDLTVGINTVPCAVGLPQAVGINQLGNKVLCGSSRLHAVRLENPLQVEADRAVRVLRIRRIAVIRVGPDKRKILFGMRALRVAGCKRIQQAQANTVHFARAHAREDRVGQHQIIGIPIRDQRLPVPVKNLAPDRRHNDQSDACPVLLRLLPRDDLHIKQSPDIHKAHGAKQHRQQDISHQMIPLLRHVYSFPRGEDLGPLSQTLLKNFLKEVFKNFKNFNEGGFYPYVYVGLIFL